MTCLIFEHQGRNNENYMIHNAMNHTLCFYYDDSDSWIPACKQDSLAVPMGWQW